MRGGPEQAPPAPTLHHQRASARRGGGIEASQGEMRTRGTFSKPLVPAGLGLGSNNLRENNYFPSTKYRSTYYNPTNKDNKFDDFEDSKINGYGNLSK